MIDKSKLFDNVTQLLFSLNTKLQNSDLKFSNVKSLSLYNEYTYYRKFMCSLPVIDATQFLKNNVNLSKLNNLELYENYEIECASTLFLEIFKEAPHLSTISISIHSLLPLLNNDELCKYFNKMITKLELRLDHDGQLISFDELKDVLKIFSNIEELRCNDISVLENAAELLNLLPKLSNLYVWWFCTSFNKNTEVLLRNNLLDLDANFELDSERKWLHVWIGRRMR